MSDTKYQVFVSSTFTDLKEERMAVTHAILDIDHIPAGMEMFPAADIQQMDYIKRVIDECDYYVLIIAGRYGAVDESGISYTHQEYAYAKATGKPILAFLKRSYESLPIGKTDQDTGKERSLKAFIEEVKNGRLVQYWDTTDELNSKAIVALTRAIKSSPQTGWIRGDRISQNISPTEILAYKNKIEQLTAQLAANGPSTSKFACSLKDLTQTVNFTAYKDASIYGDDAEFSIVQTDYCNIVKAIGPSLFGPLSYNAVVSAVTRAVPTLPGGQTSDSIDDSFLNGMLATLIIKGFLRLDRSVNPPSYQFTDEGLAAWLEESQVETR
jgi:hypothetical protein